MEVVRLGSDGGGGGGGSESFLAKISSCKQTLFTHGGLSKKGRERGRERERERERERDLNSLMKVEMKKNITGQLRIEIYKCRNNE